MSRAATFASVQTRAEEVRDRSIEARRDMVYDRFLVKAPRTHLCPSKEVIRKKRQRLDAGPAKASFALVKSTRKTPVDLTFANAHRRPKVPPILMFQLSIRDPASCRPLVLPGKPHPRVRKQPRPLEERPKLRVAGPKFLVAGPSLLVGR